VGGQLRRQLRHRCHEPQQLVQRPPEDMGIASEDEEELMNDGLMNDGLMN
jgi:hypothetical protein